MASVTLPTPAGQRARELSAGLALPRIEHVNLNVSDLDATAVLLNAIFGWKERWRGFSQSGCPVVHVGSGSDYVALCSYGPDSRYPKGRPFNHLGIEVPDLDAVEARVSAAGLTPFSHGDYEPGRRFYFLDPDGIEYEVVSYA